MHVGACAREEVQQANGDPRLPAAATEAATRPSPASGAPPAPARPHHRFPQRTPCPHLLGQPGNHTGRLLVCHGLLKHALLGCGWVCGVWGGWVGGGGGLGEGAGGQEMSGARRVGGTGGCHGPRPRPVPAASLCPPAGPRVPLQPRHRPHLRLRQHELLQHRRRLWGEVQGAGGLHLEAGHVAQVGKGARRLLLAQKGGWRGTAGEGVAGSRRCNSGTSTHRCAV